MEEKPSFQKSISIDVKSVTGQSFDVENAQSNLAQLQRHVFKIEVSTNKGASHMPLSRYSRVDSVDDDDLFGPGNTGMSGHMDGEKELAAVLEVNENEDTAKYRSNTDSMPLPNFAGLGFDEFLFFSAQNDDNANDTELGAEGGANVADVDQEVNQAVENVGEDDISDEGIASFVDEEHDRPRREVVGSVYRSKRSISDTRSRRKGFCQRADIEIMGDDLLDEIVHSPEELENYRRSNSLPDVISSSSLKSLSDSNPSSSPDVTQCNISGESDTLDQLHQKKSLKDEFEGCSSFEGKLPSGVLHGKSSKDLSNSNSNAKPSSGSQNKKPLLGRMVSFSDNVQCQEIPNSDCQETLNKDFEKTGTKKMGDLSPSEKRQVFSASSGYQTGSDAGSQDRKLQSQNSGSACSDVSIWASGDDETQAAGLCLPHLPVELTISSGELNDEQSSGNSHSTSSKNTVISNDEKRSMEVQSSEFGRLRVDPCPKLEPHTPNISRLDAEAEYSKSFQGNLPNILNDSSFIIGQSMLKKVDEEDDRQLRRVQMRYTDKSPGSAEPSTGYHGPQSERYSMMPRSEAHLQELIALQYLEQRLASEKFSPSHLFPIMGPSDSSTPDYSPAVYDHRPLSGRRLSPDLISFSQQDLEQSARCSQNNCQEQCCVKLKTVFKIFSLKLPSIDQSYDLLKNYCLALHQHAEQCDELACPVSYCHMVMHWLDGGSYSGPAIVDLLLRKIQMLINQPVTQVIGTRYRQLIKFQPTMEPPEDYVTHIPLSRLGNFSSAVLCQNLAGNLCVIKKYPLFEESQQLSLYQSLTQAKHTNIVPHFWLLEFEDTIQVETLFMPGGNLRSLLDEVGSLSWEMMVTYVRQILFAVSHLHHLGIAYLYWKSENILFETCARSIVKISNFCLSVPIGKCWDPGSVKECLPANICPPELILQNCVTEESDCWGVGCLMAEMLSGYPVFHPERHFHRNRIHHHVRKYQVKVTGIADEHYTFLKNFCWQKPDQRKSIEHLEKKLQRRVAA